MQQQKVPTDNPSFRGREQIEKAIGEYKVHARQANTYIWEGPH